MKKFLQAVLFAVASCMAFAAPTVPIQNAQVFAINGTAAAPSYSFTSDTGTGWYRISAGYIGLGSSGAAALLMGRSGNVAYLQQGQAAASFLSFADAGAANITLGGTNQSITLTPSGTGYVQIGTALPNTGNAASTFLNLGVPKSGGSTLLSATTASQNAAENFTIAFNSNFEGNSNDNRAAIAFNNTVSGAAGSDSTITFTTNKYGTGRAVRGTFTAAGNFLLGGLTTDGTGVLQFPTGAADNTSGLGFSTDTWLFRAGAGEVRLRSSGTNPAFGFMEGATLTGYIQTSTGNMSIGPVQAGKTLTLISANVTALTLDSSQTALFAKKISSYNGVATAGWGVPAIQAAAEITAQSAAATITSYTVGAADGTFEVSAQLDCTAATGLSTTLTCTYTDKSNTARTMILPVQQVAGSFIALGAITGTGVWETPVMHIRCKASTVITILTSTGTFSGVVYSADATIIQTN